MRGAKISFVIPVYNAAPYLPRLIKSLQSQKFEDWEALFTDDGSSDGSLSVLRTAASTDTRIRIFEIAHEGSSGARNKGLDNAIGDVIAFVDADDFIHPQLLEIVLPIFGDNLVDAVMFDFVPVPPESPPPFGEISVPPLVSRIADPIRWALSPWKPTAHGVWRTFYRRSVIGGIRFFPKIKHQDLLFSYQVWGRVNKMLKLDCTLYAYVQTPGSVIRSEYSLDKIDANFIIMRELNKYYFNCVGIRRLLQRRLFPKRVKEVWKQVSRSEASFSGPLHRFFFENVYMSLRSGLISLWSFLPCRIFIFLYGILRGRILKING